MPNLLGYQSQVVTDAYRSMVRATWPNTLKVIYPGGLDASLLREWRSRRPDGLLVFRHYFPDEDLAPTKYATILNAADQIADLHPILEVPVNEAHQTSADEIARLADYSAQFVRLAADQGYTAAVGVFSEGNPSNLDWWAQFRPALLAARQHGGYLALHEYGIPSLGFEDWHLLRHRRVWAVLPDDARVPILVTECGIDGGIEGRREVGWRGYMDSRAYADWLRRYHAEIARDAYVHGATLFLCGCYPQWASFSLEDEVDLRGPLTEAVAMPARWTPPTGGAPVPDVVLSVPTRVSHAADENWGAGEPFGPVKGVVIHSTGGSGTTLEAEYIGTINWFQNPAAGVSAHAVIGAGKFAEVCRVLGDVEKAYHAREPANTNRRGIEFAHPDGWDQVLYPDSQYEMAGELIARWHLADKARGWAWPLKLLTRAEASADAAGIVFHRDLPAGINDGRRDPTPPFDATKLLAAVNRWYAKLTGGTPVPTPPTETDAALLGQLYALAGQIQALEQKWQAINCPHRAAYVSNEGEAIKEWVNAAKGQK